MIITSHLEAYAEISDELLAQRRDEVVQAVGSKLARQVINEGENVGAMIREQSVRVHRTTLKPSQPSCVVYAAQWYPKPEDGCLFIGGPMDGEFTPIQGPNAPDLISFPQLNDAEFDRWGNGKPIPTQPIDYQIAGKDSERDCWVYEYKPQPG